MTKISKTPRYKILIDHITKLEILDRESNQRFLKHPNDILFNDEYKEYSIEDVARIGFICGQMSGCS
jgi:hypothetical protein